MGVQYIHAREGYEFEPTTLGEGEGRINAKYKGNYHNPQYKKVVPQRWLTNGLVREVKIKDDKI